MANVATHTSTRPLPPATAHRAAPRKALHLPPASAHASKAAALTLFRKFAARSALPLGSLRAQLIPDATWKRAGDHLGPSAAQTVARLTRALEFATRTWQSEPDAIDWLLGPHIELAGQTPYALLRTETGAHTVEYLIAALEFGFPV